MNGYVLALVLVLTSSSVVRAASSDSAGPKAPDILSVFPLGGQNGASLETEILGTDLDGAFGKEQSPYDLETIADLQKIPGLLNKRGYNKGDVINIMHGNWLRFLRRAWNNS